MQNQLLFIIMGIVGSYLISLFHEHSRGILVHWFCTSLQAQSKHKASTARARVHFLKHVSGVLIKRDVAVERRLHHNRVIAGCLLSPLTLLICDWALTSTAASPESTAVPHHRQTAPLTLQQELFQFIFFPVPFA